MLAAITCHFNPIEYENIVRNYWMFREDLKGADLFTIELSFTDQFEIEDAVHVSGKPGANAVDLTGDADDICEATETCVQRYLANASEIVGDGIGDDCDSCPNDPDNDKDSDGICGDVDPCWGTDNDSDLRRY